MNDDRITGVLQDLIDAFGLERTKEITDAIVDATCEMIAEDRALAHAAPGISRALISIHKDAS